MVTLKTFSFFLLNSTAFTPPLLHLGVSSKVIHHALNNCKSFLLNAKQASINIVATVSGMVLASLIWFVPIWEGRL
jgi:hypothetical protein